MKHTHKLLLLIALVALTSCGKDDGAAKPAATSNPSVRADGSCTSAHVNDYNRVNREMKEYVRLFKAKASNDQLFTQLRAVDSACNNFLTNHNPATQCVAVVNGQEKMVDGMDLVEPCKKIKEILK